MAEPIIFRTGDEFCALFKIKPTDPKCNQAWDTAESHLKVTVPLAATPKFFTWEGPDGDVCVDTPEGGGTCPMSARAFGAWAAGSLPFALVPFAARLPRALFSASVIRSRS